MAKGVRLRYSLEKGTLGASLAASSGTETITFGEAPGFDTLGPGEYIALILGVKEVVHLTDYSSGSTTGTIERGQDGTQPASHSPGDPWIHGPTAVDLDELIDSRNGGREIIHSINPATATQALDLTEGNVFDVTLAESTTFSFSNVVANRSVSVTLVLRQNATGGWTVTWPASVKWDAGSAPSLETSPNSIAVVTLFTIDGGATWFAGVVGDGFA